MDYSDVAPTTECYEGPEAAMIAFALDRVRAQFAWKTGGLTATQLRSTHPPSRLTIAGLIKHMAFVEERCSRIHLRGLAPGPPWDSVDWSADPEWDWHSAVDDEPDELYALWYDAVTRANAVWAGVDPAAHSALTIDDGEPVAARRVLIDLLEEYLRHTGHADCCARPSTGWLATTRRAPERTRPTPRPLRSARSRRSLRRTATAARTSTGRAGWPRRAMHSPVVATHLGDASNMDPRPAGKVARHVVDLVVCLKVGHGEQVVGKTRTRPRRSSSRRHIDAGADSFCCSANRLV